MRLNFFTKKTAVICLSLGWLCACNPVEKPASTLFTPLSPQSSGVTFSNDITENADLNIIDYLYMYNGGGVAVGDVNRDGFVDIYFTANQASNKLYLNQGDTAQIQFEDITEKAGVGGDIGSTHWTTGVSMVDINADGWLDIYVCQMHGFRKLQGKNKLYINQQNGPDGYPTFSEEAADYGLDISSYAQQAAFFDYDQDGDLDMYLLNQAVHTPNSYKRSGLRTQRDSLAGDRLYENIDGKFHDVSEEAGIYGGSMGYGLALAIGDIDNNGLPDIYVSNDFHENDYLYYNQGKRTEGTTFTENMAGSMGHNSTFSMGNDLADFNNDLLLDVISLDMKPFDESILKSATGVDPYSIYEYKLSYGYFYQYSRNMLQLNQGQLFADSAVQFSEIGQLAGVDATDWSWSPLFADLDNDGLKDLFITNGIPRRPNDQDYIKFVSNETRNVNNMDAQAMISHLPEGKVANKAFKNLGLAFEEQSKAWGLDKVGISQGAAYADLDNDGDLDLIVNNLMETATIYENNSKEHSNNNYLRIRCQGDSLNTLGIGSRVTLVTEAGAQMQELYLTKGWLSSMAPELHFGLGAADQVKELTIRWSDGKIQTLANVPANHNLVLKYADAKAPKQPTKTDEAKDKIFTNISEASGIDFQHKENDFVDFEVEQLMPHFLSTQGPKLAVGDVNLDGLEDFYIGGAKGQPGAIYVQQENAPYFQLKPNLAFDQHQQMEDTDAAFFDADADTDLDLYVVSGGGEPNQGDVLQDRLYINDGAGNFTYAAGALPPIALNGACVVAFDSNQDGFTDLFIGTRSVPQAYGISPNSMLLINDGKGKFTDQTEAHMPDALRLGMVSDAVWLAQSRELIVVGEWMPVTIFKFAEQVAKTELPHTSGWWNTIHAADMDGDGDLDLLAGNMGENSNIKASVEQPVDLYVRDFDGNARPDPILSYYRQGKQWVYPGLDQLAGQIVQVKKVYQSYKTFAESSFSQIFPPEELEGAVHKQAQTFQSAYIENLGGGKFAINALPVEAQFSSVHSFATADFDRDGHADVLAAGNFYGSQPSIGRHDAAYGLFLKGNGQGDFEVVPARQSGFTVFGEVRSIGLLTGKKSPFILVSRNNASTRLFNYATPIL